MAARPPRGGSGDPPPAPPPGAAPGGDLALARAIAAAVDGVPGVAAVSPGRFAEAATYGPGGVVRGVVVQRRAGALAVEVHLCAAYAPALHLPELAARVRRAVAAALRARGAAPAQGIDVAVDDLWVGASAAGPEGAGRPVADHGAAGTSGRPTG
jgi:uncharacterized alkaline shock family protein YloU